MSITCNLKSLEEVENKEDIMVREEGASKVARNECAVMKRKLWCNTHECGVKSMNVTSKKWQYNEKKMKYMYMSKCVKKYVCPANTANQVQLRVVETGDVKQTMIESKVFGSSKSSTILDDDYSGAMGDKVQ